MALTPKDHAGRLDATAAKIDKAAEKAFAELRRRIRGGEAPRDILDDLTSRWSPEVAAQIAPALSDILSASVTAADVLEIEVGTVSLSRRMYDHARDVNGGVRRMIEKHTKGFTDARALALDIFEGYEFRSKETLAVDAPLPKYLVEPFKTEPGLRRELAQILARIESAKLKTPALKAAYTEALDALEAGKGDAAIARKLKTAYYERNRYLANRIAQTELHRAQSQRIARETMGDDGTGWVQIRLSRTHPEEDVCDYHSKVDQYGLGGGVYPKHSAPLPPFHPFCRCVVVPRTDIDPNEPGRFDSGAAIAFFRDADDKFGAKVAGSPNKLEAIRAGRPPIMVFDAGKEAVHRTRRVGGAGSVSGQWKAEDGLAILAVMKGRRRKKVPDVETPVAPVAPPPPPPPQWAGTPEMARWFDLTMSRAPDVVRRFAQANAPAVLNYSPGGGAYYQRGARLIDMNGHKDHVDGVSPWRRPRYTWLHEYGHFADNVLGGGGYAYRSTAGDWLAALDADARHVRKVAKGGAKGAAAEYDAVADRVVSADAADRPAIADAIVEEKGFAPAAFREFFANHTDFDKSGALYRETNLAKAAAALARGDVEGFFRICVKRDVGEESAGWHSGILGHLSDLIGATSNNAVCNYATGWPGHAPGYYKTRGGRTGRAPEAAANIFAAYASGDAVVVAFVEAFAPAQAALFRRDYGL